MDQFLGAAVTGLELEQLQAVVIQLSQEVGAERVVEACAAQAVLAGKPGCGLSASLACPQVCRKRLEWMSHQGSQVSLACVIPRLSATA